MQNERKKTGNHSNSVNLYAFTKKQIVSCVLAGLVLIAGLWIWKAIQIRSLRQQHSKREQAILDQANHQLEDKSRQFLKLISKPYVWAIRKEMMQGNTTQLALYGDNMVKEEDFVSIIVIDEEGKIIAATDKKYEGKGFGSLRSSFYTNVDHTVINRINDSLLSVASPVMGFNSKLGTLIMDYSFRRIPQ